MSELNDRAAKAMGWVISDPPSSMRPAVWIDPNGTHVQPKWKPDRDYNHARMLYARAIDKGLAREVATACQCLGFAAAWNDPTSRFCEALLLTPAQLTEACLKVLELDCD